MPLWPYRLLAATTDGLLGAIAGLALMSALSPWLGPLDLHSLAIIVLGVVLLLLNLHLRRGAPFRRTPGTLLAGLQRRSGSWQPQSPYRISRLPLFSLSLVSLAAAAAAYAQFWGEVLRFADWLDWGLLTLAAAAITAGCLSFFSRRPQLAFLAMGGLFLLMQILTPRPDAPTRELILIVAFSLLALLWGIAAIRYASRLKPRAAAAESDPASPSA